MDPQSLKIAYTVIIGYLMFLFGLGFAFRKFNSNVSDYFRSGCRGTWWLVGISVFVSGVSSRTFTANAGVAYNSGWTIWLIYLGGATGAIIDLIFLAPRFRQMRATTFPEIIERRFGWELQQFSALMGLFGGLVGASLILWSLGVFCGAVFGMSVDLLIIGLGLVVLFYSVTGGRWAVMATDFLQTLIMVPMAALVTWLCYKKIGGVSGFVEQIRSQNLVGDFNMITPTETFPGDGQAWAYVMFGAVVLGTLLFVLITGILCFKRYDEGHDYPVSRSLLAGLGYWIALITVPTLMILLVPALYRAGGVAPLLGSLASADWSRLVEYVGFQETMQAPTYGPFWGAAMFVTMMFGSITLGGAIRYFSVKDGREARKSSAVSVTLATLGIAFWLFPPMVARLIFNDHFATLDMNNPEEAAYAVAALKVLPASLIGLITVAMFAAAMSTMDTALNVNAGMVTIDIYPFCCRILKKKPMGAKGQFWLGQGFSVFFGLVTIVAALKFNAIKTSNIFEIMQETTALIHIPLLIPQLMGIFVKRAPYWGTFFSMGVTLCFELFCSHKLGWPAHTRILMNTFFGCGAFMATTPFWRYQGEAYKNKVRDFFRTMNTPVNFAEEVGEANDSMQLSMLGWFSVALGTFVLSLVAFPSEDMTDNYEIMFVAGIAYAVGTLLLLARKRARRREAAARQARASEEESVS